MTKQKAQFNTQTLAKPLLAFYNSEKVKAIDTQLLSSLPVNFDKKQINLEMIYLRGFTINFFLTLSIQDDNRRNNVFNSFYERFKEADNKDKAYDYESLKERSVGYTQSVKLNKEQKLGDIIGLKFAKLCGHENNQSLITIGTTTFSLTYQALAHFFQSVTIQD